MKINLWLKTNEALNGMAKDLKLATIENESRADLIARIQAATGSELANGPERSEEDIQTAVALVIEADDKATFGEDGYPLVASVAALMEGDDAELTEEQVQTAADAVWDAKEDAQEDDQDGAPGDTQGGGINYADDEEGGDVVALPEPREEVIAATVSIMKEGSPFERGVPALWALRDKVGGPVKKAEAAAAYEAVTGNRWPWPPTAQEMKVSQARLPAGMYHPEKPSITVHDEAQEEKARKDGYARPGDMKKADMDAAFEREVQKSRNGAAGKR